MSTRQASTTTSPTLPPPPPSSATHTHVRGVDPSRRCLKRAFRHVGYELNGSCCCARHNNQSTDGLAMRTKGRVRSPTPAETEQYSRLFDTDVRQELRYERCITYMHEQIDIICIWRMGKHS